MVVQQSNLEPPNVATSVSSEPCGVSAAACSQSADLAQGSPPAAAASCSSDQSVDPAQPKKRLNIFGITTISASEQGAQKALVGAGTLLLVVNGIGLPFILPKITKKFLGAPFLPMKRHTVNVLFDRVLPSWAVSRRTASHAAVGSAVTSSLSGLRLVDFGSGDGRIVAAAASQGMRAVGYELNPWLVFWSRIRSRSTLSAAPAPGSGQLLWANAWDAPLKDVDVVTIYGRPRDGVMDRAAAKCEAELSSNAVVISHHFDVPGWERLLVQDVDGLKLYDFSLRKNPKHLE